MLVMHLRLGQRRRRRSEVIIYDPNFINPYGDELAALLEGAIDVTLYRPRAKEPRVDGVRTRFTAAQEGGHFGRMAYPIRRLFDPVQLIFRGPRRAPIIIVWTKRGWDRLFLRVGVLLGRRIIQVVHNPPGSRTGSILPAPISVRGGEIVVHSERLTSGGMKADYCLPHPPFDVTAALGNPDANAQSETLSVVFLGDRRWDKGFDLLPEIVARAAAKSSFDLVIAGKGPRFDQDVPPNIHLVDAGGDSYLDTMTMLKFIRHATVIIAPYREATQSGSIMLAFSVGTPTLAFRTGALPDILRDEAMVEANDASGLGNLLADFLQSPWSTYRIPLAQYREVARTSWINAVKEPKQ